MRFSTILLALATTATTAFAAPGRPSFTSNKAAPAPPKNTPLFKPSPKANLLPPASLFPNEAASVVARSMLEGVDGVSGGLEQRDLESRAAIRQQRKVVVNKITENCVGSWANDTYISSLFYYGGKGTVVSLCPGAVINITNAVFMWGEGQVLQTLGLPEGPRRAKLVVTEPTQTCALYAAHDGNSNIIIKNIQIDGARDPLGIVWGGYALVELGGNNSGQTVSNCHLFEPRGWSALHIIEGYMNSCDKFSVVDSQIGPAGHGPSGDAQLRLRRRDTGVHGPGEWADGISLACKNSLVARNVLTDCSDGFIVLFGGLNTTVTQNKIIADQRQTLGGVNLVDWGLWSGTYNGVKVTENTIIAKGSLIKLGIAVGGLVWGVDNRTIARTSGGEITNNVFKSGPSASGMFNYAIAVASRNDTVVTGNRVVPGTSFGHSLTSCLYEPWVPAPPATPWVIDPYSTTNVIYTKAKDWFAQTTLAFLICQGPGPITYVAK